MRLILENWKKFIKESKWSDSEDEDWPASSFGFKFANNLKSNLVIVFNKNDTYGELEGLTHGLDSHMAKHYAEFFPSYMEKAANDVIEIIKKNNIPVYTIDKSGNKNETSTDQIKIGDIINSFDHINDKNKNNQQLEPIEKVILDNVMSNLSTGYDGITDKMIKDAVDISDSSVVNEQGLIQILSKRGIVKFKAVYDGKENTYYVNAKSSAVVSQKEDGQVATLHVREKKTPGGEQVLKSYYRALKDFMPGKGTVPTNDYSIYNKHMESLKAKQSQPQTKKKKRVAINKDSKHDPMSFALDKIKNTKMSDEQILKALMGKFKLPIKPAEQILDGAKRKI